MSEVEYLITKKGTPKAIVIPIKIWNQFFLKKNDSNNELSEALEDYCLNKAIDEGKTSSLLNYHQALAYLEDG